jgi:stage III sporulation protein AG
MDKKQGPITNFKKWISKEDQPENKAGKYRYMIIVLCIGAVFMLAGNIFYKRQAQTPNAPAAKMNQSSPQDVPAFGQNKSAENKDISSYEQQYESELKTALDDMLGVKDTKVVVNVDSTEQKVLETNKNTKNSTTEETDANGGKRKVQDSSTDEQMVIVRNGDQESPVVVQTKKPEIRGVLVVAKGAEDIEIKKRIVDAVTRVLDVPSYRVAVMPEK